jgi:Putative transposase DNA-binding domain
MRLATIRQDGGTRAVIIEVERQGIIRHGAKMLFSVAESMSQHRLTGRERRTGPQEKFHCQWCGHQAHADTVGALNVLRAGLVRREADPA